MSTPDLDYLPLPAPMRKELRNLVTRSREWPRYKHVHNLPSAPQLSRVRLLQAAWDLGFDPENRILDYYEKSGAQFGRRKHLDGERGQQKALTVSERQEREKKAARLAMWG